MATIKIPYTYTTYAFSKEATKYSQKLAKRKGSVVGICIVTFFIAFAIWSGIMSLFDFDLPDAVMVVLLIVFLAAGIAAGIMIDRKINQFYCDKRDAALRRDVIKLIGEVSEERMQEVIYELTHTKAKIEKKDGKK